MIVGYGGGRVPHRRVLGGRGGPHVGVPGGLLEAAEAPGAGPHPLQVVTPALEGVQGGHDVLDNVVLLRDLPLDLLPLNLPVLIVDGAKQPDKDNLTLVDLMFILPPPVNLLDHPLVVDGGRLVVPEQAHLPRQLRVLADVRHGDGHGEHR